MAIGESKAEIVQRALEVQALPGALPAQLVRPKAGRARWVLDALAAQELNVGEWESSKVRSGADLARASILATCARCYRARPRGLAPRRAF